jgi:hypothetical protein
LATHGIFPKSSFEKTGLPKGLFGENGNGTRLNFLEAGVRYADVITTIGVKADKISSDGESDLGELLPKQKKSIISLTSVSHNGSKSDNLAERFISIYRDLLKN